MFDSEKKNDSFRQSQWQQNEKEMKNRTKMMNEGVVKSIAIVFISLFLQGIPDADSS